MMITMDDNAIDLYHHVPELFNLITIFSEEQAQEGHTIDRWSLLYSITVPITVVACYFALVIACSTWDHEHILIGQYEIITLLFITVIFFMMTAAIATTSLL